MPKMTAMDAAVSILYDEGVRHIFGIPGAGILPFYKSMKTHGKIKPSARDRARTTSGSPIPGPKARRRPRSPASRPRQGGYIRRRYGMS